MTLHSGKTIRALSRGIAVMRTIEQQRHTSLQELYEFTGIAKASLSRILLTLQAENLISQRIADNHWVLGASLGSAGRSKNDKALLVQASVAALDRLCEQIIWPSDLSVRSGLRMVLMESSRPHSSLLLNRLKVGFEIDFVLSAPGRAYLAFCAENERESLIQRLTQAPRRAPRPAADDLYKIIKLTRDQGYGIRDPHWGGHISKPRSEYDDGINAIAVPIMHGNKVLGCINIAWIRKVLSKEAIVKRNLLKLQQTAQEIADAYLRLKAQTSRRAHQVKR